MKLIILDRDGVINHDSDAYIKSVEQWQPIAGSLKAIARLHQAGYKIAVATNQSGIARGYYTRDTLSAMHDKMQHLLKGEGGQIDYIAYCPHGPDEGCDCRKPKTGMLEQIAAHFACDLSQVTLVGDSIGDYLAAQSAAMPFALVKTGKGLRTLNDERLPNDVAVYHTLEDYVNGLLAER